MCMPKMSRLCACLMLMVLACKGLAVMAAEDVVQLGRAVTEAELQEWDLIVMPDGTGLPVGQGSAEQGRAVYEQQCAACHGATGLGMPSVPALANDASSQTGALVRTVGNYWPYATTLFDYIRRAMPPTAPKSLSSEQTYQVVAYVLFLNGIIANDFELTQSNLPAITMPNKDGFVDRSQVQ